MRFQPADEPLGSGLDLVPQLQRWMATDEGVCDAFFEASQELGHIAMLQGRELLIVAAAVPN